MAIGRILDRLEAVTDVAAAIAMGLVMVVVCLDVFMRYFLHAPLAWSTDVLILYLIPAVFFLGLPGSYTKGSHIAVDLALARVSPRSRQLFHVFARLVVAFVSALLLFYNAERFAESLRDGEVVPSAFARWPVAPSLFLVLIGFGLVVLRACERGILESVAVWRGEVVPTPDPEQVGS